MKIVCVVVGHKYGPRIPEGDDTPAHWACKRCGSMRYTAPTDIPPGAADDSGGGGGYGG